MALLLGVWAVGAFGTLVRPLFAAKPLHCHCPAHAKHDLPTGPTFAPCDDDAVSQASAATTAPAVLAHAVALVAPARPGLAHGASLILRSQSSPAVITPPPRRLA